MCRIPRLQGGAEATLTGTAALTAITNRQPWARPPIDVDFQVLMFTASGLLVRFLKVFEKNNYNSVKWVRYLTKASSSYQIRVGYSLLVHFHDNAYNIQIWHIAHIAFLSWHCSYIYTTTANPLSQYWDSHVNTSLDASAYNHVVSPAWHISMKWALSGSTICATTDALNSKRHTSLSFIQTYFLPVLLFRRLMFWRY